MTYKSAFATLRVVRYAGAVFWKVAGLRRCATMICALGVVVVRCLAWIVRATVCASVIFVGPSTIGSCW